MIRFLQTPGPLKKIILGGLLLIICAAMVITLVPGGLGSSFGFGGPGRGVIAKVDGEDVTTLEVQREARQMVKQQFPSGGSQVAMLMPFFTQRAAEELIDQKAMLVEAHQLGLRATDQDVRDEIEKNPQYAAVFFPGGSFIGETEYEERLQSVDLTVPQFEQIVKNEILLNKLRNVVAGGATVGEAEVRDKFVKDNTKVKFDYAVLHKDDISKAINPSEAELKAYYDSHKASYKNSIPEKRKIRYVLLDTGRLADKIQVSQQELQAYYDEHRDEFRVPEQVLVSHILIKTPLPGPDGKVDQKAVDAAKVKAEDILKQLKAGANFADLAKKDSEDETSAKSGGSLGWVQKGRIPSPEVEKAAFSLPKGGTSGVINAGYGFDIIHVDDKQDAHLKTIEEVKPQVEPIIRQQRAAQEADSEATALLSQAHTEGLDKAAAAKGLQLVSTDFIGRRDALPGIGPSPQFLDAVFNEPEKSPPDEVKIPQGYAIFEVEAIQPSSTPTFEQIRTRVETEFKGERATALLNQKTQELSDRAKAEHDLKKAAKELGATMKASDLVAPDSQVPDIGSLAGSASVIFTMKPGDISGPIMSGVNGAVAQLVDKQLPPEQDFAAKKDQIRQTLLQTKQSELFGLFVGNLRDALQKSGKIKINQEELKSLGRPTGESDEGE